jgi:hypothetical protein
MRKCQKRTGTAWRAQPEEISMSRLRKIQVYKAIFNYDREDSRSRGESVDLDHGQNLGHLTLAGTSIEETVTEEKNLSYG